jgi:hypothetical protein
MRVVANWYASFLSGRRDRDRTWVGLEVALRLFLRFTLGGYGHTHTWCKLLFFCSVFSLTVMPMERRYPMHLGS